MAPFELHVAPRCHISYKKEYVYLTLGYFCSCQHIDVKTPYSHQEKKQMFQLSAPRCSVPSKTPCSHQEKKIGCPAVVSTQVFCPFKTPYSH